MVNNYRSELTGQRFGRLVVVVFSHVAGKRNETYWHCKCDCGKYHVAHGSKLSAGEIKSCGCITAERNRKMAEANKKPAGEASFNALLIRYKNGARKRGFNFSLPTVQFKELVDGPCYYCGTPPEQVIQGGHRNGSYTYNGIDRVDSNRGYEPDNCVSCCGLCNWMKKTLSMANFLKHISKISENHLTNSIERGQNSIPTEWRQDISGEVGAESDIQWGHYAAERSCPTRRERASSCNW